MYAPCGEREDEVVFFILFNCLLVFVCLSRSPFYLESQSLRCERVVSGSSIHVEELRKNPNRKFKTEFNLVLTFGQGLGHDTYTTCVGSYLYAWCVKCHGLTT